MTMQKRKKMTLYMKVFFAALISLIQIMPIVVVVVNSFRGNDEISKLMLGFPTKFHFENYAVAWTRGGYAYAYASSLIIGFELRSVWCCLLAWQFMDCIRQIVFLRNFLSHILLRDLRFQRLL